MNVWKDGHKPKNAVAKKKPDFTGVYQQAQILDLRPDPSASNGGTLLKINTDFSTIFLKYC